ncbi:MAG TPA: hypothetical protein VMS86_13010 [Thermoanaerobaculia bacterium]|nr:hypothetical protein [Thermoanaerobaculia bacterium]
MTPRELVLLLAVLGVAQVFLWLAARLLGSRLPARVAAAGIGLPLLFLSPWLLTSRLLVPSDDLSSAVPGAAPLGVPDPYAVLNDVVYQLLPWELEVRHALADRRLPLWSDSLEGGSSPWLNPQSGALSPIAFLSRPLPIQHHLTASLALKMTIALEGTWLLARALGVGSLAATLAGLGFALSGGIQAWALLPPSTTVAWVPWVALAALRIVRSPGAARRTTRRGRGWPRADRMVAGAAVLVACLLLSGNPEVAAFGLACAAVWAALLGRRPIPARAAAGGVLAVVLGGALAAPVLAPFLVRLPEAQRLEELAHARVPLETLDWAPRTWFLPRDAVLLEAPLGSHALGRPFRGLIRGTLNWAEAEGGYAGLVALAGAVLALVGRRRRRALPFLLTSLVGLALAAGFLPLRAVLAATPGAGLAATGRLLPLVALGLWIAAALGIDPLVPRRLPGAGPAVGRLSPWAVIALVPIAALSLRADARLASALLWIGIAVAVWVGRSRPRTAGVLLAAVLIADLAPWAHLLLPRGNTAAFYPATPAIERLRREAAAPGGPWRATGEDLAVYPSLLAVYGLDEPRPHNPLAPRDYARVLEAAFDFAPARRYFSPLANLDHPLLDYLGVRSVVSYSTRPGAPGYRPVPATLERIDVGELGTFRLLRNRDALPRVFVPTAADVVRADQLERWIASQRDPRRVALLDQEVEGWRPPARRWQPRSVEVVAWRPGRIQLRVAMPAGGLVATSIPGPAGWSARSGAAGGASAVGSAGARLERLRVNGAFLGIRVPPGVEEITLGYRPPGFLWGVSLAAIAVIAVAALLAFDRPRLAFSLAPRRARRRPRPAWVLAAALALYLAVSLAHETMAALRPYWVRGPNAFRELNPAGWRLASPPAKKMAAFLELAASRIPDGSRVAFAGVDLPGTQSAYRAMWAAYLLPRHHVVPAGQAWEGDYWIAYRTRVDRRDLELIWENDDGALYRAVR